MQLKPFSSPGRFWRGNLHTHSNLSDGKLPLGDVVAAYKNVGYDFLMMSEHYLDIYGFPIADTRQYRGNDFTTILGVELHAPVTSVGEMWHIVCAGLPLDFKPPTKEETGPELARRARDAGAFIAIAHPSWSRYTIEDGRALDMAHAVEIYNHGCEIENDLGYGWYLYDQLTNEGRRLSAIATDDAHFKTPDHFGGWVNVKSESLDPDALLTALKAGEFYASQGPQIHDVHINGKELTVSCSPVDSITVICGNSRTVVKHGRAITGGTLDLTKLEPKQGWLLTKVSPWFRVAVIDQAGKKAWTQAYWYEDLK